MAGRGGLCRPLPEGRANNEGHTQSEVPFAVKTAKSSIYTLPLPFLPLSPPHSSTFSRRSPLLPESFPPLP